MVGIPDGLGAYDNSPGNANGTFTVLMNHELGSTAGTTRAHGAIGSFVSEWVINKSDFSIVSGNDLIQRVYGWNSTTQVSNATTSTVAFNRFCSADLAPTTAFKNGALGTTARIYLNGEEGGANGYGVATVATGSDKGSAYVLGKFNLSTNGSGQTGVGGWENLVASPYAQDKTIVIGTNDGGTGIMSQSVAVYVGTKTSTGTDVDKAGLTNGTLKFLNVTGNAAEIINTTTRATGITSGTAFTLSTTASTAFSRPEDVAWDTISSNKFYFATTDRIDTTEITGQTQVGRTRLWSASFNDITNPDAGGTINLLVDGDVVGGQLVNMFDNITVGKDGTVYLQEDVGGAAHNGKIWAYNPTSDSLSQLFKHDAALFGDVVSGASVGAVSPYTNDEESSGVIEITDILGRNDGKTYLLTSDQAHYTTLISATNVEGGQLLVLSSPSAIPEPSSYTAIAAGVALLGAATRRRRRNA